MEKASFDRITCAARNIHLSVIESVNNNPIVLRLTEKVKKIVEHFHWLYQSYKRIRIDV